MFNEPTINSVVSFGKYKRKIINEISIEYLINLSNNLKCCSDKILIDFIKNNIDILKQAAAQGKVYVHEIESLQPPKYNVPDDYKNKKTILTEKFSEVKCSSGKRAYGSQNDAAQAIKTINKISSKDKIPRRKYFCTECGKWHLSSIPNWKKSKSSE